MVHLTIRRPNVGNWTINRWHSLLQAEAAEALRFQMEATVSLAATGSWVTPKTKYAKCERKHIFLNSIHLSNQLMSEQSSWKFESSIINLQPHAYVSRQNVLLLPLPFWGLWNFKMQWFQAEPTPLPLPAPESEERPGHGVIEGHPNTGQLRHILHRYCTYWLICHEYKIHTYYIGEYLHFRYLKGWWYTEILDQTAQSKTETRNPGCRWLRIENFPPPKLEILKKMGIFLWKNLRFFRIGNSVWTWFLQKCCPDDLECVFCSAAECRSNKIMID